MKKNINIFYGVQLNSFPPFQIGIIRLNSKDLFQEKLIGALKGEPLVRVLLEEDEILNAVKALNENDLGRICPNPSIVVINNIIRTEFYISKILLEIRHPIGRNSRRCIVVAL